MSLMCNTITDYPASNGGLPLLYSIRDCVPFAFEGLVLSIFLILFSGQYFLVKNRTGRAKILIAMLSSSIFTTIISSILVLTQLITFKTVILYAFLSIISFIMLQLSDNS